jgi:hypothetical protein
MSANIPMHTAALQNVLCAAFYPERASEGFLLGAAYSFAFSGSRCQGTCTEQCCKHVRTNPLPSTEHHQRIGLQAHAAATYHLMTRPSSMMAYAWSLPAATDRTGPARTSGGTSTPPLGFAPQARTDLLVNKATAKLEPAEMAATLPSRPDGISPTPVLFPNHVQARSGEAAVSEGDVRRMGWLDSGTRSGVAGLLCRNQQPGFQEFSATTADGAAPMAS